MKIILPLLFVTLFTNCASAPDPKIAASATTQTPSSVSSQSLELIVDGNKKQLTNDDILIMGLTDQKFFSIAAMSEKQDLQFSITAFIPDLKPGTYIVYACKEATVCDEENEAKKQSVLYGPFPKNPMSDINKFRFAYSVPELNLQPLTLIISSVTDEPQPGIPYPTKRVIGTFSGTLAFLQKEGYDWKVVGEKTNIEGKFSMYCVIR